MAGHVPIEGKWTPEVSVVLPVFNGARFVEEAVQSILAQTLTDFELIIIDDGSSDETWTILSRFCDGRIKLIRNARNLGLTRSLNVALGECRAPLIARQDADDRSHPERLNEQLRFLRRNGEVVLVGSAARAIDGSGRPRPVHDWIQCTRPLSIQWQLMFENPFIHSSTMFRTAVVRDQLGGYDQSFRTNQDLELWSRVARFHRAANIPERLVDLRYVPGSASRGYSVDAIRRVGEVVLANREHALNGSVEWDTSLDVVLRATNPSVFAPVREVREFIVATEALFARFCAIHPEAVTDGEIVRHRASLYSRVAAAAAYGSPFTTLPALRRLVRLDAGLFRSALFRVLLNTARGWLRSPQPGRREHLGESESPDLEENE
jgi:glycosyltransferase involved in cell wall biosynthesis